MNTDVMFSSKTDLWATSKEMFTTAAQKIRLKRLSVVIAMAE